MSDAITIAEAEATPGRKGWVLIENDGAIFRGPGHGNPMEVWSASEGWRSYGGAHWKRGIEWGSIISAAEAARLMALDLRHRPRNAEKGLARD